MENKNEYRLVISIDSIGGEAIAENDPNDVATAKNTATVLTAYNVAQPFINSSKAIIQNNIDTKIGSQELSARINLGMQAASFTAKTAIGMFAGKSLASMLGISSSLGVATGLVTTLGMQAMNFAVKQNEINNKIYVENEQLNILRGRAGVQFNRSRSGE